MDRKDVTIELSIVIVTHNSQKEIINCLNSLTFDHNAQIEIIAVDNWSADETVSVIRKHFPTVQLLPQRSNIGFARACNMGFGASHGRYILLLNPDTVIHQGALQELVGFGDLHPNAGVVGPMVLDPGGALQHSTVRFPDFWQALYRLVEKLSPGYDSVPNGRYLPEDYGREREVDVVLGSAALIRREVWQQIQGLDETYFLYFEDTDFCYRVKKQGWKLFYTPSAKVTHVGRHSTRIDWRQSELRFFQSQALFYRRNYGRVRYMVLKLITILGVAYLVVRDIWRLFRRRINIRYVGRQVVHYLSILMA